MRVLFVVPYFAPAWSFGGPVKVVYDLSQELRHLGHQVTVATTDVFSATLRHRAGEGMIDGIVVYYFRNVSNRLAYHYNLYLPIGFRRWLRARAGQFDVIHCHDLFTALNVTVAAVSRATGVPFIVHPHGALNQTRQNARFSLVKKLFLAVFPAVVERAAAIVASTTAERRDEFSRFPSAVREKVRVIPNGVDVRAIRPLTVDPAVRHSLGVQPGGKIILYFGRIHHIKGLDISLRALALLTDQPFTYVVIGRDDGAVGELTALAAALGIADRVRFVGPTFGAERDRYLAAADVFLFNSRSEGLPMAVLDACAAGLPAIVSAACNVPEISSVGAGMVLAHNTPEATADALREYFADPARQAVMRQRCRQVLDEYFNLTTVAKTYINLYTQLVTASPNRN